MGGRTGDLWPMWLGQVAEHELDGGLEAPPGLSPLGPLLALGRVPGRGAAVDQDGNVQLDTLGLKTPPGLGLDVRVGAVKGEPQGHLQPVGGAKEPALGFQLEADGLAPGVGGDEGAGGGVLHHGGLDVQRGP